MDERPTHLDLFSGIGGFALAAQWAGFRTIGFCEIDKYCQKVLAKNFLADASGDLCGKTKGEANLERNTLVGRGNGTETPNRLVADCKIFGNIFDLDGRQFAGVSLITGGFPCQPFSVAGKRRGAADDRAIWPEMFRVIKEARPSWVLGENVPGIIPMELDNVLSDLESIGYATGPFVIPACAVDARHRRDRLWIVAHAIDNPDRTWRGQDSETHGISGINRKTLRGGMPCGAGKEFPNTSESRLEGQREIACGTGTQFYDAGDYCRWEPEPDVGRVAHGVPVELDFIRRLENETIHDKEAIAEINPIIRQILRTMWECQELAATSPDIYRSLLRDLVPEVSYEYSQSGWLLGKRIKENQELCDLWKRFYSASQQEEQDLQRKLLERIGQTKRPEALGSRVDRLKGLGNAIVPQCAYEILREIRKFC